MEPILKVIDVSKSFSNVNVLNKICLSLYPGEVHCLVGENGAGKSTLCKIISGVYSLDSGTILLDNQPYSPANVKDAQQQGIGFIHQELNLVSQLTVMENIFLGSEIASFAGRMNWQAMAEKTQEIIEELELDISPWDLICDLSISQQQMVEIAKAILHHYRIIIFDEPTSSISRKNIQALFKIIHKLKAKNVAMIYISHKLDEFEQITDRVTVMRDGCFIASMLYKDTTNEELVRLMVGRDVIMDKNVNDQKFSQEKLRVENLSNKYLKNISFPVYKGEILGFAGLVGAGRTEVLRAIFGADHADGKIYINGQEVKISSPLDAVNCGLGLLTEDRKTQGLILNQNIIINMTLTIIKRFWNGLFINTKTEKECVQDNIKKLRIVSSSEEQIIKTLSGGNQQKVILARWLESNIDILLFDEPTRGIDIGARSEIYILMKDFVKNGGTILMASSDLPELLTLSDRILVMKSKQIVDEIHAKDANEEKIMRSMVGV